MKKKTIAFLICWIPLFFLWPILAWLYWPEYFMGAIIFGIVFNFFLTFCLIDWEGFMVQAFLMILIFFLWRLHHIPFFGLMVLFYLVVGFPLSIASTIIRWRIKKTKGS